MIPLLGQIDLTAVSDGIDAVQAAVIGIAAGAITAGVGLMAIKFGGRWIKSVFKIFSN